MSTWTNERMNRWKDEGMNEWIEKKWTLSSLALSSLPPSQLALYPLN